MTTIHIYLVPQRVLVAWRSPRPKEVIHSDFYAPKICVFAREGDPGDRSDHRSTGGRTIRRTRAGGEVPTSWSGGGISAKRAGDVGLGSRLKAIVADFFAMPTWLMGKVGVVEGTVRCAGRVQNALTSPISHQV